MTQPRPILPTTILVAILCLSLNGCGPTADAAIRRRFDQFSSHLLKGETDACVGFVDPAKVKSAGTDGVKGLIGLMQGLFKLGGIQEGDVRCDKVEVAADGKSASVHFSFRKNGNWEAQAPARWVNVDGQWYATF